MSARSILAGRLATVFAASTLAWTSALGTPAVQAQELAPVTAAPVGAVVDLGDGWLVSVRSVTLRTEAPVQDRASGRATLIATLDVQNTSSEAWYFPTYRVRAVDGGGGTLTTAWCGRDVNPLELVGKIGPREVQTGSICWGVDAANAPDVVMSVDPALGHAGAPLTFALAPVTNVIAAPAPPPPVAPAPLAAAPPDLPAAAPLITPSHDSAGAASRPGPTSTPSTSSTSSTARAPTAGTTASGSASGALWGHGVPACQLYPSARQPTGSTSGAVSAAPTNANGSQTSNTTGSTPFGVNTSTSSSSTSSTAGC